MFTLLKKIFGTAQSRKLQRYRKTVSLVNAFERDYQKLSSEELIAKTAEFKKRIKQGTSLDELLPEAYAVVKNACRRLIGHPVHVSGYEQKWDMIPYDVQVLGAIAMHYGAIAEMQTGEGKTLTAAMPLYLNALAEQSVHLVTVNDYLAKRDCEWIGAVFSYLGIKASALTSDVDIAKRAEIYQADIVYGTAAEFGFDYLRDHSMAMHLNELVQQEHYFAIIDEIDSILIDEARTPLIISGPAAKSRHMYDELKGGVASIVRKQRDLCHELASKAKKTLDTLGLLENTGSKKQFKEAKEAFEQLWLVGKGTPTNKILKRLKENPDIRAALEKKETYFYSDQNKEEKLELLADLFIVVDERASDYELTDKGIQAWSDHSKDKTDDFVMLDLGFEYAQIEDSDLSDLEKMERKIAIRHKDAKRKERAHNLRQLFRAHLLMEKDIDYIVQDQKIIIIDENTGRPQPGRRFGDGLHQAIEAKEGVTVQGETQTYASITLQNYFRMYKKLAGMTGTAITEATEFKELYELEVLAIPTYKSCIRQDFDDEIYMTEREKYGAILKEIKIAHEKGQPILIGTESVEISEKLSRILKQNRLPHTVLNAKHHQKEAEIIANAGKEGSITIATNMAGRGTDIKLTKKAKQAGGLKVIGTTRHQSRRTDRQLRGRSGRLGDPGSSKFFVSFEDSLMRLFASPRITNLLQRFRPPEGEPISAKVLNKSIETAQKRVEQRNYASRKHTLEYDDVMNKQRSEIYTFREELLASDNAQEIAEEILEEVIRHAFEEQVQQETFTFSIAHFHEFLVTHFPINLEVKTLENMTYEKVASFVIQDVIAAYHKKLALQKELIQEFNKEETNPDRVIGEVIRNLMLRKTDLLWQEHLTAIDHLRSDVHIQTIGQKDPLLEFKEEAFRLFRELSIQLRLEIAKDLFRFEMMQNQSTILEQQIKKQLQQVKKDLPELQQAPLDKVKRNDSCPCGSGKKHKKCCAKLVSITSDLQS